ncbi:UNVERIFIED_CONTAM: hypothetical protein K2H54_074592 [Gekko kuhli]
MCFFPVPDNWVSFWPLSMPAPKIAVFVSGASVLKLCRINDRKSPDLGEHAAPHGLDKQLCVPTCDLIHRLDHYCYHSLLPYGPFACTLDLLSSLYYGESRVLEPLLFTRHNEGFEIFLKNEKLKCSSITSLKGKKLKLTKKDQKVRVRIYMCVYICVCIYMYTHTHTHTHTYI